MSVNVQGMELEVRKAAMALLPDEPNAVWVTVSGEENDLGEVENVVRTEVPVRVVCLEMRQAQGKFSQQGIIDKENGHFLVAKAKDSTEVFEPKNGEILQYDGNDYRSKSLAWLPVEDHGYFDVRNVRC